MKKLKVLMYYVFIAGLCFEAAFTLILLFLNHILIYDYLTIASDHWRESEPTTLH